MCGLCLPHCPTYRISRNEGESPRGRISLIKAYAQQKLPAGHGIQTHLQSCTGCMQCERVCPAKVDYQSILDQGRQLYRARLDYKTRSLQTLGIYLLTTQWGQRFVPLLHSAAAACNKLGVLKKSALVQLGALMHQQRHVKPIVENVPTGKRVTVFSGCSAQSFDRDTLRDALKLIAALGYQAQLPQAHLCCSALAQHSGRVNLAAEQRRQTHRYLNAEQVVSIASGCGDQLDRDGIGNSADHSDIHSWLVQHNAGKLLRLKPMNKKVLLHIPCSMHAAQADALEQLVHNIPGVRCRRFNDEALCCGAGGMQLVTPQVSNTALLQSKMATVIEAQADIIITANVGCRLQLQKGLAQAKIDVPVLHTVSLLAGQLME